MNLPALLDHWLPSLGKLNPLQQQALDYLHTIGLPNRRHERWKYTDVQRFLSSADGPRVYALNKQQPLLAAQWLESINAKPGLQAHWQARVLTTSTFQDGIDALHYLLVPEALVIAVSGEQQLQLFPGHNLPNGLLVSAFVIEVGSNAHLTLLETDSTMTTDSTHPFFCFSHLELHLSPHSICHHAWLGSGVNLTDRDQDINNLTVYNLSVNKSQANKSHVNKLHISKLHVKQQNQSHYQGISLAVGNALCRREHQFDLIGTDAKVKLNTLSLSQHQQLHEMRLTANHLAPQTACDFQHYAVADGQSVSNCNGRIHISPAGHQAEGAFISKSLLLSTTAQINTQPELEIYHDQVRCSHGATTSALDDDQRLYLRARGLDEHSANALLLEGFVRQAFDQFGNEGMSAPLWEHVIAYLRKSNESSAD